MDNREYRSSFYIPECNMDRINEFEQTELNEILNKINSQETKEKINGIFYEGKYGKYDCKGSSSKDNPYLEFKRRTELIKLASNNIGAFEQIINNNINLYQGTNLNALPGIIKQGGMLSENESYKKNNPVLTGEKWSRIDGVRREFISFTDQIDRALKYSLISPSENSSLESFGIIIGISSDDIKDLRTFKVSSDIPELGVIDMIPINRIKTIFVPNDKIDFVSKMIENTRIASCIT